MLTCKEATRLVSAAQDRKLGLGERLGLYLHLLICALCRRYARQIALLTRALRDHREEMYPPDSARLDAAARDRIGARLK